MFTDICFTNMSPNIHLPSVTLFQRNLFGKNNQLLAWKVIRNCHYQWTHPFRIDWAYEYQLFDAYGNLSPINSLSSNNKSEIADYGISINHQPDHVIFKKRFENKIEGINLLKNKRIIASHILTLNHQIKFNLSTKIFICADLRAIEGGVIHSDNLNISLAKLDIYKKKKISLIMQGGQSGPLSKPLKFIIS